MAHKKKKNKSGFSQVSSESGSLNIIKMPYNPVVYAYIDIFLSSLQLFVIKW